jgi:hypothetical protein
MGLAASGDSALGAFDVEVDMSGLLSRAMLALALPVVAMAVVPAVAHADTAEVTVTVGATGTLLDRTLVVVPVEITCAPMEVAYNQGSAQLRQAVSGQVAYGQGWPDSPITCDGAPHANSYRIWVDAASPAPFRQGDATVVVGAYLCSPTFVCQSGSSGPQVIRLKK